MSNPDLPWFPWYVRDALSDSRWQSMPAISRGCFVQLLMYQWENGSLDPERVRLVQLAAITDIDVEAIGKTRGQIFDLYVWRFLAELFPKSRGDGRLRNKKLHILRDARLRRISIAVASGRRGGKKREGSGAKRGVPSFHPLSTSSLTAQNDTSYEGSAKAPYQDTSSDADADADADADEEKRADAKPPIPSPPIRNPVPPKLRERTHWGEFTARWNALAFAEDLPKIGGALSDGRKRKARAVMGSMRRRGLDWFEVLAGAVRDRRGAWARGTRFPTLDQALREEIVDKLAEGFYERDRQALSSQPDHLNRQTDFENTKKESWTIIRPEDRG